MDESEAGSISLLFHTLLNYLHWQSTFLGGLLFLIFSTRNVVGNIFNVILFYLKDKQTNRTNDVHERNEIQQNWTSIKERERLKEL